MRIPFECGNCFNKFEAIVPHRGYGARTMCPRCGWGSIKFLLTDEEKRRGVWFKDTTGNWLRWGREREMLAAKGLVRIQVDPENPADESKFYLEDPDHGSVSLSTGRPGQ